MGLHNEFDLLMILFCELGFCYMYEWFTQPGDKYKYKIRLRNAPGRHEN